MIPVTIKGQKLELANRWEDVTIHQYRQLYLFRKELNPARVLSILSGINYIEILNYRMDAFEKDIMPLLTFIGKDIDLDKLMLPTGFHWRGNIWMPLKRSLRSETWGQKIVLQQRINQAVEKAEPMLDLLSYAMAMYYQPEIDGPLFDDKKAVALIKEFEQCKVVEIYPIACFFLRKYVRSLRKK